VSEPARSYLVCATPRSGSTLVCKALRDTGVAGRPEEYFEALRSTGRPRRPEQYFAGVDDPSIFDELGEPPDGQSPPPAWSRTAYDRYLIWAKEAGTTPNGVFASKLMWQYLGDFVGLLRNIPDYRDLPLSGLFDAAFPDLTFVRVVRASKIRQAVSLWKAVQTASWSDNGGDGPPTEEGPYRTFLDETHKPPLRFHYRAIDHLLQQTLAAEASWDAFFEHIRIKPILVLYENFAADYRTSTLNILDRLGLDPPPDFDARAEPGMRKQSDGINDDWARRFSELRLGRELDLVPASPVIA